MEDNLVMNIKQSVINTFNRVGIPYEALLEQTGTVKVVNRFGYGSCETTPFVAHLIQWVYETSNRYERGDYKINISDFDRVRYFVLATDSKAYMTCLD